MNEHEFAHLLGGIDPELVARAEQRVPVRRKPIFKVALVAAVLAALLASLAVVAPFIPITPDLDYATSPEDGREIVFKERNVWIYYTENGRQRREYVRLPGDASNVFLTWAHFCGLGEDAVLYDADVSIDEAQNKHATLILSPALRSHPDAERLLGSLQKTFARYYGMPDGNVEILFVDEIEVIGSAFSAAIMNEFGQFMETYGFSSAVPSEFKQAVMQCAVNGVGVFDLMTEEDLELAPGYQGERWEHDQASYSYSQYTENKFIQTYENHFEISTIPDSMTLPYGIAAGDTLSAAFEKIVTQAEAQGFILDVRALESPHKGYWLATAFERDLLLTYQPDGYYTITYKRGRNALSSNLSPGYESELVLYFSGKEQRLCKIGITVKDGGVYQPIFEQVTLDNAFSDCIMLPELAAHFANVFNSQSWKRDSAINQGPELTFDCDGIKVHYANGLFFTQGYYWIADGYTRDCTDALLEAITALGTGNYVGVLYYAGEYYGHNAEVDRTLQDAAGYTGQGDLTIGTHALIVGYRPTADSAPDYPGMSGTRFEVYDEYLVTEDGIYFEKFTEIAPEFNKSTVLLLESPYTNRVLQLSNESLSLVREVFSRAEIRGYTMDDANSDPTITYNTIFTVNDYTIEYDPASGKARIGHWKLYVRKQDQAKILELLEQCSKIG
ncbi:MAG: hypothetical protein E7594_03030 [Ruminococcaceae bacterium]|nr:hypothetical protein [Oscillospiraceae bacterium]